ncbi:hypothetical protein T492DRAFT_457169 [Pavlovales sp. CCMP2436]|nr:hypothetical protein T492DRAFT_457169 [Pavlovales sp. CCMP2436]
MYTHIYIYIYGQCRQQTYHTHIHTHEFALQLPFFGSCPDSAQSGFELVCCHRLLHNRSRPILIIIIHYHERRGGYRQARGHIHVHTFSQRLGPVETCERTDVFLDIYPLTLIIILIAGVGTGGRVGSNVSHALIKTVDKNLNSFRDEVSCCFGGCGCCCCCGCGCCGCCCC